MFPPSDHKPLSGSRLARILECPGSFKLGQKYESKQSSYAAEGTMLHHVVEKYLETWPGHLDGLIDPLQLEENIPQMVIDPEGEEIYLTQEQRNAVGDCLEYLGQIIRTCGSNFSMEVEMKTSMYKYDACLFESGGTCDIVLLDPDFKVLHIIDWKFGQGIPVYAQGNDQLLSYGVGAMLELGLMASDWQTMLHVVQPRLDNYDTHVYSDADIVGWLNGRVLPGVNEAYSDKPSFNPGKAQCRWCPAKYTCKARRNKATQVAADVFGALQKIPDDISTEEIGRVLVDAPIYEDYISDLRKYAQRQIESGKQVPGWKMVHGRSQRRWKDIAIAQDWLEGRGDIDFADLFTSKLVSPSQAEKLSRSLKKDEDFLALIEKPEGKPTMVKETDKRQAIEYKTAAQIFGDLN